ncbi:hypothetical protein Leryth_022437 [Lithospermum erythrorhizon]|nr:hypothetical protein Leryth_022437 [Lithospermum erythrorhizon]
METMNSQYSCPPPSLELTTPNQETMSSPHIQLHCKTFHHDTTLEQNPMLLSFTYQKYYLHLHTNNFARNLVTLLIECEIPQTHRPHIVESICDLVEEKLQGCNTPLPPCLFHVHVTCHKFYYR